MALIPASLPELKAQLPDHVHVYRATTAYYEGPLSISERDSLLKTVSTSQDLISDRRSCVLFGYGSRPRRIYSEFRADSRVRLLWDGPFVPWPLVPVSWIAAAHGGLVQLLDRSAVAEVFRTMGELAMVELYSFGSARLDAVVEVALSGRWRARIGPVAGSDPAYFSLGADGDNPDSPEGILGWVSFGGECPTSLQLVAESVAANSSGAGGLTK
jgi:hypothetical protein